MSEVNGKKLVISGSGNMNNNGDGLWKSATARFFSIGISSIISIGVIFIIVFISICFADYFYVSKYPISLGEDDLGRGLVVMAWAGIAFFVSLICVLPLFPTLYRFVLNRILKIMGGIQ